MGWKQLLGLEPPANNVVPFTRKTSGPISPWQQGTLAPVITSGLFGNPDAPVTRLEALRVPAIAKARAVLHSLIASRPLRAYRGDELVPTQPAWLYRSDTGIDPALRTRCILDDLIFAEASLLAVKRGADDTILDAVHVPYDSWHVNPEGQIVVNDQIAQVGQVIWIPGPGPGLLITASQTIRAARAIEDAWTSRVRNPFPAMIIKQTEDVTVDDDDRVNLVNAVAEARRDPDNAVAFLPYGLDIEAHQSEGTDLFESGRNAIRLDFANHLNLPAALLDGSVSEASLTYSTQEGRRNELFDYTIPFWAGPIEQALSLDNVVPRGQRVRFDFTDLLASTASPTGAPSED